jgi:3-mercaptopyruvate sulfurtransferase SseA
MRRRVFIPAVLALAAAAAALFGACKATDTAGNVSAAGQKSSATAPATGTTEVHADGVRRIGPAQLKEMLDAGSAVLYDTRAKMAYDAEHIKGSISMPFDEVANRSGELPKDKTLVFYCT